MATACVVKCVASQRAAQALAKAVEVGTEREGLETVSLGTAVGATYHAKACASPPARSPSTRL
eukprot:702770-Pleurochrysis_carterae.AAC.1